MSTATVDVKRSRSRIQPAAGEQAGRCFLCDKESDKVIWREGPFEGRLCTCGLLYCNPLAVDSSIDSTIDYHPDDFYADAAKVKAAWMATHCGHGKLLEVGCGDGFFLSEAIRLGFEVSGLEPNTSRADRVRRELGVDVETNLLEENEQRKSQYDVVYHCDLLAHFPDPVGALKEMVSLLRPGGVLCFEGGILSGISPIWYHLIRKLALGPHRCFYSHRSLELLLEKADLEVDHIEFFGLGPYVIVGRISAIFKHIAIRLFKVLKPLRVFPSPEQPEKWQHKFQNFLRYRVGRFSPKKLGPQTFLVVVRPKSHDSIG
jgi:SAM-dependent methyltransferase